MHLELLLWLCWCCGCYSFGSTRKIHSLCGDALQFQQLIISRNSLSFSLSQFTTFYFATDTPSICCFIFFVRRFLFICFLTIFLRFFVLFVRLPIHSQLVGQSIYFGKLSSLVSGGAAEHENFCVTHRQIVKTELNMGALEIFACTHWLRMNSMQPTTTTTDWYKIANVCMCTDSAKWEMCVPPTEMARCQRTRWVYRCAHHIETSARYDCAHITRHNTDAVRLSQATLLNSIPWISVSSVSFLLFVVVVGIFQMV